MSTPRSRSDDPPVEPVEPVETPRRRHRRVTTVPPAGSDPEPSAEPERHTLTENDERLKQEKPPHY